MFEGYIVADETKRIQELSCDVGWQSAREPLFLATMSLVPSVLHMAMAAEFICFLPRGLIDLPPWALALAMAAPGLLVTFAVLYGTATWLYVKPLNARAAEMIRRTPP
jgi:hypothetical protein